MYIDDVIAAITTAPGVGGVGIIRVSGQGSFAMVDKVFRSRGTVPLGDRQHRTIQYGHIVDPEGDKVLDEVLLLIMKAPHSYTAEDVVEIQCHGGPMVVRTILQLLLRQGARLAEAGEFTKRAFLNGRIDLTQAEAIADIIDAKSEQSLVQATTQLAGGLGTQIRELRDELIALIAQLEVTIDYPEEDIEDVTTQEVATRLVPIQEAMERMLETAQAGRLLREGVRCAIIGRPNAGKSSLLNALLRENRAIVTDIPGTTRDSIEEYMVVRGIPVHIIDTAGIRDTEDVVEQLGVTRAKEQLAQADLVLCVIDGSKALTAEERQILRIVSGQPSIVFINKADQGVVVTAEDIAGEGTFTAVATISAQAGDGLDVLGHWVEDLVYGGTVQVAQDAVLSNVRQSTLMKDAKQCLVQAQETIAMGMPVDCVATDIRGAWELLGDITGDTLRESMVDELFKRFCLGK